MSDTSSKFLNDSADFWLYDIGSNPLPADTKNKKINVKWREDQDNSIPIETHEFRKKSGHYNSGIAVMTGRIHKGKNLGKYLTGIDCDNQKAIEEICKNLGYKDINELGNWTRVEQHKDNLDKAHIYILSTKPFKNKGRDPNFTGLESKNQVPAIEIKCEHQTMFTAPSIHQDGYPYEVLGVKEPVLCDEFEIHLDNIFKKYNIAYLELSNNYNNNKSSSNLPEELRKLILLLEIPKDFQFRIQKGSRHQTMLSFANTLLNKYKLVTNVNIDELKNFFLEVNDKLCVPPLPSDEIQTIWRDALKFSKEKSERIKVVGDDENDASTYRSQVIVPLDYDGQLLEIVQHFGYDTQANSVDCSLNSKYKPGTRIFIPINIKQWPDVRKDFRKQCEEKGIEETDIVLLLEALDRNIDLIKKHYLENNRKGNAASILSEARKRIRTQLIMDGTEFVMAKYTFKTIEKVNDILFYDIEKGVYDYGGEVIIGREIEKKYGYQVTTGIVNEIRDHIIRKTGVPKDKFDAELEIINVKNGLLNIRTRELLPHTSDYLSLNQIPITYDAQAKAPKYEQFCKDVFYPDQIRTANEIVAYTFIRKNIYQYWFVLIGNGGNGKNVFIGIITGLHGKKNISNVPLAHLGNLNLRFATSQLENKNINFDTELSKKSYNDLSTLKKFTDTQPITIEKKGKDLFDVELWAKQILSCNVLPPSSDDSDARYRREIVLPFPYQFVEEKDEEQQNDPNIRIADPFLLDKIINDENEMSGILNIVLDSLNSIYDNKKIYSNSTINQRRAKAELIANPVKAFYEENCQVPSDSKIYEIKEDLYKEFVKYCNSNKLHTLGYRKFIDQLKKEYHANDGRAKITDENGNEHKPHVLFNIILLTDEEKKKRDEQEDATAE
jgi:P4 family phage/plasmid primase-like protien